MAARVLAHPGQLPLIFRSKNKNDRNDAERLAKLLYLGERQTVHVPSPEVRAWRELISCRRQVIAKRTRAKNAVRALLRSAGAVPPRQPGFWTKKGLAWLRQLALPIASQQLRRDLMIYSYNILTGLTSRSRAGTRARATKRIVEPVHAAASEPVGQPADLCWKTSAAGRSPIMTGSTMCGEYRGLYSRNATNIAAREETILSLERRPPAAGSPGDSRARPGPCS
jgi:hypothetical protein